MSCDNIRWFYADGVAAMTNIDSLSPTQVNIPDDTSVYAVRYS